MYFRSVELVVMLNCLYMALWVTNFISVANGSNSPVLWHIFLFLPIVYNFFCMSVYVKKSALIHALGKLNHDVIGLMEEEREENEVIVREMKDKVLKRIEDAEHKGPFDLVTELFADIDTDGNGEVSRAEFRIFLNALQLPYSDAKFHRLFKMIDKDNSKSIQVSEMLAVLFPEVEIETRRSNSEVVMNVLI